MWIVDEGVANRGEFSEAGVVGAFVARASGIEGGPGGVFGEVEVLVGLLCADVGPAEVSSLADLIEDVMTARAALFVIAAGVRADIADVDPASLGV